MNVVNRIVFNTIILYVKIIICSVISLCSVPLVLNALGASDYGLYNLMAGVIAMLSFLSASMTVSTQRYMSIALGTGNLQKINRIYNVSIILHLLVALILVGFLEVVGLFIFDGFLNIEVEKIDVAKTIYQYLIISVFFSVVVVPFDAILNAYENLLVFSLISIMDSILKLIVAFMLYRISEDKLLFYSLSITLIVISAVLCKCLYVKFKYNNLKVDVLKFVDREVFLGMSKFASWNTLNGLAQIGRNQGVAVILNIFLGTLVNAAYGIANQINGVLNLFSSSLQKSLNPQLMKSEGMNDRTRLLKISFLSSKYSVLLLSVLVIPLLIELPSLLLIWLSDIPEYTISFSSLILIISLIGQYSVGLQSLIQAIGKIKYYAIVISCLLLSGVFVGYFILKLKYPPEYILIYFICIEFVALLVRIYFAKNMANINVRYFIYKVFMPTFIVDVLTFFIVYLVHLLFLNTLYRIPISFLISIISITVFSFRFVLDYEEKKYIVNLFYLAFDKIKGLK